LTSTWKRRVLLAALFTWGCSGVGSWGDGSGGADTSSAAGGAAQAGGAPGTGTTTNGATTTNGGATGGTSGTGGSTSGSGGSTGGTGTGGFGPPDTEPPLVWTTFSPSDEDFVNPERGFHADRPLPAADINDYRGQGLSLVRSYVVLDRTADAIPAGFLSDLTASLGRVRDRGLKVVIRFAYGLTAGPDAPLDRVLSHISQVTPILQANSDVILVLQAGFIGQWGEWHDSTNGIDTDQGRRTVLETLLDALPPSRMIQVRYPWKLQPIFPDLLSDMAAYSGSGASRVGLHDDCFVADATDSGTYWDFTGNQSQEVAYNRDFASKQTRYVPYGGETCANNAGSGCATAPSEAATFHFTYLNAAFQPAVNARWTSEGCMPEIRRRLGYRIELERAAVSREVAPGGILYFEVVLKNVGYAAPFNARPAFLVLDGGGQMQTAELTDADFRRWHPEAGEITVSAKLRVPASAAPGTYRLALWLPDAAPSLQNRGEYAVRFANANVWSSGTSDNTITTGFRIDAQAMGSRDPGADRFAVVP